MMHTAVITFDPKKITLEKIIKAIEDGGFEVLYSPQWIK